ncbi:unnamed protein product, partial [Brassica oleracea var. botrytis]
INDDEGLLKSSSTTSSGDKGNNDSHCRRSKLCESNMDSRIGVTNNEFQETSFTYNFGLKRKMIS